MLPRSFTPDFLRQLELMSIRARRAYLGTRQGGHTSPKRGHGIEFADYRKYELGDDPRHIDWGVFARSERLYVRRFREEQDMSAILFVDGSGSMRHPEQDSKWMMARDVALALAYILLMQQDRVMLSVPGHLTSPFLSGGHAMHRLAALMDRIQFEQEKDFIENARQDVMRVRFPGLAVVVSDLLMPFPRLKTFFDTLRGRNLDITVIQVLGKNDRDPFPEKESMRAVDSESGEEIELMLDEGVRKEYQTRLNAHNETLKTYFKGAGIRYVVADPAGGVSDFMLAHLIDTGLLQ